MGTLLSLKCLLKKRLLQLVQTRLRACFKSGLLPPGFAAVYTPVSKSLLPRQKSKSLLLKQALILYTLLFLPQSLMRCEFGLAEGVSSSFVFFLNSGLSTFQTSPKTQERLSSDLWILPTYQLNAPLKFKALLYLSQDYLGEKKTEITKSEVGAGRNPIALSSIFSLEPSLFLILPFATGAIVRDSLIIGAKALVRTHYDLSKINLGSVNVPVSGYYDIALTRFFHNYETKTNGISNSQVSLYQAILVSVALVSGLSLDSYFGFSSLWSYRGNLKNSFLWSEEFGFAFSPKWSVALGISNDGNALKANGVASNVDLINPHTATASVSATYKY